MVTIDNQSIKQLPDPSARLTLSVENLTFVRLLQLFFELNQQNFFELNDILN